MAFQPVLTEKQRAELVVDYEDGWTVHELTIIYKVSERTVYRVLAERNAPAKPVKKRYRKRKPPPAKKPRELLPCGTNAAYQRHRENGEYPCTECLVAHAQNVKEAKEKKSARGKNNVKHRRSEGSHAPAIRSDSS